jgi:hypothetical protein
MRKLILVFLLLSALMAYGQPFSFHDQAFLSRLLSTGGAGTPGFYPTRVVNTAFFLNYSDAAVGSTTTWTDEVAQIVLTNWGIYNRPTNTSFGWFFNSAALTNVPHNFGSNFSIWIDGAVVYGGAPISSFYGDIGTSDGGSTNGIKARIFGTTGTNWYYSLWNGGASVYITNFAVGSVLVSVVTNPPLWHNVIDSQGSPYIDGSAIVGNWGTPDAKYPPLWSAMGNDNGSGNLALNGYIKYVLISTNHAITAAEATNLYCWSVTNGVTNVTGGLVGWWKFADSTNGNTLADSSGGGWTGTFMNANYPGGTKGTGNPVWTNGLNSIVSQALYFNGSNTVNVPINSTFLGYGNSNYCSLSFWMKMFPKNYNSMGSPISVYNRSGYGSIGVYADGPYTTGGTFTGEGYNPITDNYIESSEFGVTDGKWHHLVYTMDGTNFNDYFDGVRDYGSISGSRGVINKAGGIPLTNGWAVAETNIQFSLPDWPDGGTTNLPCFLTNIRIYNKVLSDGEVDILYRAPAADAIVGSYLY